MVNCIFKQISTENNGKIRLYLKIIEDSAEVTVLQNQNAWESCVKKTELLKFSKECQTSLESYCESLLDYIKDGTPGITFVFNETEFTVKKSLKEGVMVKYFISKLKEVNYVERVEQLLDLFYKENERLSGSVDTLSKENVLISKSKEDCEQKLKSLVEKKLNDESEQMGQFLLVLNEKKRRIQHLTELLDAFKEGTLPVKSEETSRRKRKKNAESSPKRETISESEESDESSNSTETQSSHSSEKKVEELPSTSDSFGFLDDNFTSSHLLPKRAKSAQSEEVRVSVAPKSPPKEESKPAERSKSPTIDLSTQNLLDLL